MQKAKKEVSEDKSQADVVEIRVPMFGVHYIIPSLVTLMALCSGLLAIHTVINPQIPDALVNWEKAFILIIAAAVLDALDGAVARLLKATSELGAQLDSLSDFLAFGVAPSVVLYMWVLHDAGKLGWIAAMVFVVAAALRLARFNVTQTKLDTKPEWARQYFEGVPSPIGAFLSLFPMAIWIQSPESFTAYAWATPLVAVWTIFCGALMVSRLPTFSSKQLRFQSKMAIPVLAVAGFLIAALLSAPWITFTVLAVVYLVSLPLSVLRFKRLKEQHACEGDDLTDMALGAIDVGMRGGERDDD